MTSCHLAVVIAKWEKVRMIDRWPILNQKLTQSRTPSTVTKGILETSGTIDKTVPNLLDRFYEGQLFVITDPSTKFCNLHIGQPTLPITQVSPMEWPHSTQSKVRAALYKLTKINKGQTSDLKILIRSSSQLQLGGKSGTLTTAPPSRG